MSIPADLRFVPLAELPPYAMLPIDHPLAEGGTVTLAALAEHPMVLLDLPHSSDYFLGFFDRAGLRPEIAERTRDMAVMRSLVANGFGYSIANIRPLSDSAPDGRKLCFLPFADPVPPLRLGLVLAEGAENVLTVEAFMAHCAQQITDRAIPGMNMQLVAPR